jgi:hypothetical protein
MTKFDINVAVKIIADLMKEHNVTQEQLLAVFPYRPTTEAECSTVARWLGGVIKAKQEAAKTVSPALPTPQAKLPVRKDKNGKNMPQYYAVTLPGEDKLRFFRVKPGWKDGVYFVDEQASDMLYPVRQGARRGQVLGAIMKDPGAAQRRYGQEIGKCAVCGRTLTDPESREYGIGPVCREM